MENLTNNNLIIEEQKELYVATIVHDLKNPLNAQIVALEQFYKEKFGGLTDLQKEILNDIITSAKFMSEMLSTILSVYKFENGAVKLNKTEVNIDNLIKICIKDVTPLADENCIFIEYINIASNNLIYCDENYIRRVISNMLNNMINYSYKNTKSVISLENDKIYEVMRFKSEGLPIHKDLQMHIFDKYIPSSNKKSGTGLGLYFCKKAVEAHGGLISLKSQNSKIEFCIKLPIAYMSEGTIKFV